MKTCCRGAGGRRETFAKDFSRPRCAARLADSAGPPDEVVPFNNVRRRAATALLASKRTAPHALVTVAADYTNIERVRAAPGLTALPFVARAVVDALRAFPLLNATVSGDALVVHQAVGLGIAVDLDYQGLVVPVIRDADGMRLGNLAAAIRDVGRGRGRSSSAQMTWPAAPSRSRTRGRPARGCRSRS